MNKKITAILLSIALLFAYMFYNNPYREKTLKLGIFVGSNFDVYNGDSYAFIDEAIAMYETQYPYLHIEYEDGIIKDDYTSYLSKNLLTSNDLDMFVVLNEDFNTLVSIGALQSLDKYMEDESIYYDDLLESGRYKGTLYALPYEANPTMMCINNDLLEKEGIELPSEDWTIDDFYRICSQVTKDTNHDGMIDQYGSYDYRWDDVMQGFGLSLFDEQGTTCTLNKPDQREALNYASKIMNLSQGYQVTSEDFDKGNVAFCPLTIAQYRTYQPYPYRISKYSSFSWSLLPMPGTATNKKTATCQTTLLAVNAKSKYKQEAYNFISFVSGNKQLQLSLLEKNQGLPVLKEVIQDDNTSKLLSFKNHHLLDNILNNIAYEPKFKNYQHVYSLADYYLTKSFNGNSIDLDLFTIQEELENELKQ